MRVWIAAVLGVALGAGVVLVIFHGPAASSAPTGVGPSIATSLARIERRLDRLERAVSQRPAPTQAHAAGGLGDPDAIREVREPAATGHRDPAGAPDAAGAGADLSRVSAIDLSLEADERWARDEDIAGAAKRYRELLSRGGSPSERRHWFIRLGDCYVRMHRADEGLKAYRECIDASTEDHVERVACILELARHERVTNLHEALRWIDAALALSSTRYDTDLHLLAADVARDSNRTDREAQELRWLVEHRPGDADPEWVKRLAELGDERR